MLNLKLQFGLECLIAISSYPLSFAWIFDIICFNIDYHLSTNPKYHSVNWNKPIVPTGSTFVIVNDLSIWKDILMKIIQCNQSSLIFYLIRAEKKVKHYQRHNGPWDLSAFTNGLYNPQQAKQTNSKFSPNNLKFVTKLFYLQAVPEHQQISQLC